MDKIKLAAIKRKSDGIVFTGRDHAQIILTRSKGELTGTKSEMGFITDTNRFVGRKEAAEIAFAAGQIDKPATQLFSEDITGNWPWANEIIAKLEKECKRLLKCERDLRTIHEEHMTAVIKANMSFQYVNGKLMLLNKP